MKILTLFAILILSFSITSAAELPGSRFSLKGAVVSSFEDNGNGTCSARFRKGDDPANSLDAVAGGRICGLLQLLAASDDLVWVEGPVESVLTPYGYLARPVVRWLFVRGK